MRVISKGKVQNTKKENKTALIVTSVASMVDQFLYPSIEMLVKSGYKTIVCCNFIKGNTCDNNTIMKLRENLSKINVECIQIDFDRNVYELKNHIRAYKQLKKVLMDREYSFIHCHSPIGGLLARIAADKKEKVIYTAHGFHFYKGASLKNWLLFYPVERFCSYRTDTLITINTEDYDFAKRKLKARHIVYIPGVGINTEYEKCSDEDIRTFRHSLGLNDDESFLLSVGELNNNKNHISVIKALEKLLKKHSEHRWKYYICGQGKLEQTLKFYIEEHGLNEYIHIVGFTNEVRKYLSSADLFIHPSYREGLPVALMEAIAVEVPVIASDIRGNRDLVERNVLFKAGDILEIEKRIEDFLSCNMIKGSSKRNRSRLRKFDIENVNSQLKTIYERYEKNIDNR